MTTSLSMRNQRGAGIFLTGPGALAAHQVAKACCARGVTWSATTRSSAATARATGKVRRKICHTESPVIRITTSSLLRAS